MKKISFLLLSIFLLSLTSVAQTTSDNSDSKKNKKSKNDKEVTRIFTFSAMSDIHNEGNFDVVFDSPQLGFDFSYIKQVKGKMFSRGFSLGWQPIDTTNDSINIGGFPGTLKATNQMVHAHYTLRLAVFRNSGIQPYVEGIVGAKGAAITSSYNYAMSEQDAVNEIPYFAATWNYGYAAGIRLRATDFIYVDVRYARIQSGDLKRIINMSIDEMGEVDYETDIWKVPVGYLRAGLTFSF
ncbi:MAG TPA: hypothetical protein EYN28_07985 [Flavobacteriales bacterium]|jgi:hypothetical protein|nr:hypothetical protein [Flavobacteriales bacterium]HHZ97239.1 hypothetical protein [Flavobacteriales bacterium]HIB76794.1 hypothetical protein [Flavobacteriales bacterium]HIN42162.1 hypothetical protein [Flavobacteriales bacterium]HIO16672.1 hypothetical protein [Flavobacteriales bacterium]